MIYLLDYGAGNVRSLANSINKLGFEFKWITCPDDFRLASKLVFPGVGAFELAMEALRSKGLAQPLIDYIQSGKPYMGICIGMQALFLSSEESAKASGLGIIPSHVQKFSSATKTVPHIGWNTPLYFPSGSIKDQDPTFDWDSDSAFYFVHSYCVSHNQSMHGWTQTLTRYGDEVFVSSIRRANVFATQFHPEKSGPAGLRLLKQWLSLPDSISPLSSLSPPSPSLVDPHILTAHSRLAKRIIACLDVRSNDDGDLVVTKGDQYDVREANSLDSTSKGNVRNLGKPVDLARRYYDEGADEITFLNITSFRSCPLQDQPMLAVLQKAAETVFVPFCVGGGIKDTVDPDGTTHSALEVATAYFRAGADKVSIGGEAVMAVEAMLANKPPLTTGITDIARVYGRQAVVVSIDPKRVYVSHIEDVPSEHQPCVVDLSSASLQTKTGLIPLEPDLGPNGERYCWYQCTIKGGREARAVDVVQLAIGVETLGAGEILLNSVDKDGSKSGFDLRLVELIKRNVTIPIIASSGAGKLQHFEDVFLKTGAEAALAAGIFHRKEVQIQEVKTHLNMVGIPMRKCAQNEDSRV
ncbi:hypothetical protein O181_082287 [Austropuccinia psidii MF-1]|uniref:Imidazole glycerol phosphate synthase hisHF n=1 Tax=Austropuccinia psidii MF-1 TaxID=1389203 RepID=A0A9Q3FQ55_9BASI|nr:hypothetical protein [Austropuccinia psidii MF-1]